MLLRDYRIGDESFTDINLFSYATSFISVSFSVTKNMYRVRHQVGRRKTRRYMTEMGIDPIYPKMNLSKRMQQAKVCPYLLRNAVIDRPNQAWSIDITYIPIKRGFLYLTAVIDWYSRCIVGWEVDDTLDTRMVITALKKAFIVAKPVILNSDQAVSLQAMST